MTEYIAQASGFYAVRLLAVPFENAVAGSPLLHCETPKWVDDAAFEQKIQLSRQPDSSLAYLWVETPGGGELCAPNSWIVNAAGALFVMQDSLFRSIFTANVVYRSEEKKDD